MTTGPFLTVEWQPLLNAGLPLREPDDEPAAVLTVEWGPKLGPSYYAHGDDLHQEASTPTAGGGTATRR